MILKKVVTQETKHNKIKNMATKINRLRGYSPGFVNTGGAFSAGLASGMEPLDEMARAQKEMQNKIDSRAANFISQYPPDPQFDKISEEARGPLFDFASNNKQLYFQAARQLAQLNPTDPEYMQVSSQLQSIKNSMVTANDHLNDFKGLKEEYFQERANMSNGVSPEQKLKLDKIFLENDYQIEFDQYGIPIYKTSLGDIKHAELSNYSTKDSEMALEIMNAADKVYQNGLKGFDISGTPTENLLRNSLRMAINKGGQERIDSLLKDNLLEGYNISNINPENYSSQDELTNAIVDDIMSHLTNVNKDAYNKFKQSQKPKQSSSGFGQSMRDDLATTQGIAKNAIEFANLAGSGDVDKMVSLLRQSDIDNVDKIMSKQEMYQAWLASEDRKDKQSAKDDFISIYGDSPIYYDSSALPFDINDPQGLFKLYLQLSPISDDVRNYYIQNARFEKPKLPGQQ